MRKIEPRDNPCYCIKVRRAANTLTKFYDKALEPINLSISQFSLMNDIKLLEACNKSELAIYTKLDRTTIIRNLNTLRERGLVEEAPGTESHNTLVRLTDLGESTVVEGLALWKQAQKHIRTSIGIDNAEQLMQILNSVETLV